MIYPVIQIDTSCNIGNSRLQISFLRVLIIMSEEKEIVWESTGISDEEIARMLSEDPYPVTKDVYTIPVRLIGY